MNHPLRWTYGVTTVPERMSTLLPKTLQSLRAARFEDPRLFIDGEATELALDGYCWLDVSNRVPCIGPFGNWILALAELYIRSPACDRYALFQDDFVTYRNLRAYLDRCSYPHLGYWNLFTFPQNQALAPVDTSPNRQRSQVRGWYPSNQMGRGAVALVFDRPAVQALLIHQHIVGKPAHAANSTRSIDGAVITAMKDAGYTEYVHNPSLVQHTGKVSSIPQQVEHPQAISFQGENFDALDLLKQ